MSKRVGVQARLYAAAAFILAAGLSSALAIYVTAEDDAANPAYREMLGSKLSLGVFLLARRRGPD